MPLPEVDNTDQKRMRDIMFYVFISLFIALTILTILSLFFGLTKLKEKYESTLVTTFIIEVGAAVIALFYGLFGIKKKESPNTIQTRISGPLKIFISAKENSILRNQAYTGYYEIFNEETGEKKLIENIPTQWDAGIFLWFSIKDISENTFIKIGVKDNSGKKWESDHMDPRTVKFEKLHEL
jgi:hypothetical protein